MSKIAFTPNASGTGTFTIASPDSNTNRTLTLPDADGALLAGAQAAFIPATVSGATQALDVGAANFFDAGTLTADTTVSFTNVPTEARWTYTAGAGGVAGSSYDISEQTLLNTFDPTSETVDLEDLFFKPDGTKMYLAGDDNNAVYQYSLSTAWDLGTASYDSKSFSVAGIDTAIYGLFFKSDGSKMYALGSTSDRVYQYSLSTAWDVSTASYDSISFSLSGQDIRPYGVCFKPDGSKMYIAGESSDTVHQYNLSTAWNLATASYSGVGLDVSAENGSMQGLFLSEDGLNLFTVGSSYVYKYTLSTAWDLTTASYVGRSDAGTGLRGVFFSSSGDKMFVTGSIELREFTAQSVSSITFPVSVQNPPTVAVGFNDQVSYTFATLDGGTTVKLINEAVF